MARKGTPLVSRIPSKDAACTVPQTNIAACAIFMKALGRVMEVKPGLTCSIPAI